MSIFRKPLKTALKWALSFILIVIVTIAIVHYVAGPLIDALSKQALA